MPTFAIIRGVTFVLPRDPQEFASRAGRFIGERIECNVLGTVMTGVLTGVYGDVAPLFAYAPDANGDVGAVAMRLPPWYLLTSELDPSAANELVDLWLREDPEVPGVNGTPATARAIASAWARRTGGTARCRMREAMHVLERVREPAWAARGELRAARGSDRALLIGWMEAFAREAGVIGSDQSATMVDVRLKRGGLLVWDDRGGGDGRNSTAGRRCRAGRTCVRASAALPTGLRQQRRGSGQPQSACRRRAQVQCCSPTSPT